MDIFALFDALHFPELTSELRCGLELFWQLADRVLQNSGVALMPPPETYFQLSQNFFSAIFLLSFQRAGIDPAIRPYYVAMNQCLRGMVTGCDNILDDEYKMTLDTDIPGTRFRSIIDIMVADRVMFDLLLELHAKQGIELEKIHQAHAASLTALTRSGVQEAAEEGGVQEILDPERLLQEIHHLKTGVLFQSVWAVPLVLEPELAAKAQPLTTALYRIGMGCQILDDMTDLQLDLTTRRHKYLASLIVHHAPDADAVRKTLPTLPDATTLMEQFPYARQEASNKAKEYLETGLATLFGPQGTVLVHATKTFLAQRIGANTLVDPAFFE